MLVFRLKRKVPFATEVSISKELDRLEEIDMLTKTDYCEWASSTVYVKEKNYKIRTCADFSTRLNDCLETYNYHLSSLEDIFSKLSGGKVFWK